MLRKLATGITDNLVWLILAAGVLGFIVSPVSSALDWLTPYVLAVMVAGSGFSLTLNRVFQMRGTLRLTGLTLLAQLSVLPLTGFGLYHLVPNPALAFGILAVAVAPSEITSALMTFLAGGDLALATRLMAFSICLSAFLTPLWLGLFLGQSIPLDLGSMAVELGLVISLPFLFASSLRTRFVRLADYESEWGGLSALAVIILIFIVGGSVARFPLTLDVLWLVLACLTFNLCGYVLGAIISRIAHQAMPQSLALVFSSGMREFGIATAVAINFLPQGAALGPALYGVLMMLSASFLAARLRLK